MPAGVRIEKVEDVFCPLRKIVETEEGSARRHPDFGTVNGRAERAFPSFPPEQSGELCAIAEE